MGMFLVDVLAAIVSSVLAALIIRHLNVYNRIPRRNGQVPAGRKTGHNPGNSSQGRGCLRTPGP